METPAMFLKLLFDPEIFKLVIIYFRERGKI